MTNFSKIQFSDCIVFFCYSLYNRRSHENWRTCSKQRELQLQSETEMSSRGLSNIRSSLSSHGNETRYRVSQKKTLHLYRPQFDVFIKHLCKIEEHLYEKPDSIAFLNCNNQKNRLRNDWDRVNMAKSLGFFYILATDGLFAVTLL